METLKVIKGNKKNYKPGKVELAVVIWKLAGGNEEYLQAENIKDWAVTCHGDFKKLLFLSIRSGNKIFSEKESITLEKAESGFKFVSETLEMFQYITPNELLQIFPPTKEYDGEKYEMKDYFTTMEAIRKYEPNEVFGTEEAVREILWDYQNRDITDFMVNWMSAISHLRQAQGFKSPMEEFFEKEGVATYTFHEKEGYMYNNKTGEVSKITKPKKRIPKYLRKVDGGNA